MILGWGGGGAKNWQTGMSRDEFRYPIGQTLVVYLHLASTTLIIFQVCCKFKTI